MKKRLLAIFLILCASFCAFASDQPPSWMLEQIAEDLQPFAFSGVRSSDLDHVMEQPSNSPYLLVKYSIRNNALSFASLSSSFMSQIRASAVTQSIREILQKVSLPDMDFIVTMRDSFDSTTFPIPIFAFAKNSELATNIILMPDFEALSGNVDILRDVKKGKSRYPWHKKINKAFWRGATTGGIFTEENFLQFPRANTVDLSLRYSDLIDARFNLLVQCENCDPLKEVYWEYFGDTVSIRRHLRYKYQLLIDGNTCAYSRAYWQLFSNCTIFKQASPAIQWYYRCLQPFVHYVPLNADMSDLPDAITWAISHDEECYEISMQANAFAEENLSYERVQQYLCLLLTEYAKIYHPN